MHVCTYVCARVASTHIQYIRMCLHMYVQACVNVISVSVLNCNMLRMYSTGALTELCRYVRTYVCTVHNICTVRMCVPVSFP